MPAVTRKGDSCTGHECFPARTSTEGSSNVYVNNIPVHRLNDGWSVHCCTHPNVPHGCHGGVLSSGSSSVFVNNKSIGRVGDSVSCGSLVASGSNNVFAGD